MNYKLRPTRYSIGLDDYNCSIEERSPNKWALCCMGLVMSTAGEFESEPSPSNRTEEFLKEYRFDSPEEALAVFKEKGELVINGRNIKTGETVIRK